MSAWVVASLDLTVACAVPTAAPVARSRTTQFSQRSGPIDCFGHSRRFVEVESPQRLDGGRDPPCQPFACLGHAQPHDGHFSVDAGMVDPVIEAASFEGVVQVAGAIGGQDH